MFLRTLHEIEKKLHFIAIMRHKKSHKSYIVYIVCYIIDLYRFVDLYSLYSLLYSFI